MSPPTAQTPLERAKARLQDATYNALPADEMLEEAVMVEAVAVVASRTAPEFQAMRRHQHLSSLGRNVRLNEETFARITAEHDLPARRRPRWPSFLLSVEEPLASR
ncbi:hypothetical protein [Nonomuraea sp. NPDC049784]|uniref:hypothetical protein n=1 Tax=Nonomuraea sp. NPDC049784 TaxID=3154361 RepID=UPI00340C0D3F